MLEILETTVSLVSIKKSWYQYHPPYTRLFSSQRVLYLKFPWTYDICIICLHVREVCLEVIIAMFYFCYSKNPLDVMKNIFDFIYIYFWKKNSLGTNIRNKHVIRKINLFFLTSRKMAIFFHLKFYHFQYDHRFLFSGKIGKIRTYKEVRLKMKNQLESVFPCDFLQNVLIETSISFWWN